MQHWAVSVTLGMHGMHQSRHGTARHGAAEFRTKNGPFVSVSINATALCGAVFGNSLLATSKAALQTELPPFHNYCRTAHAH